MKGIIVYFSGSGNTKAACETILRKLQPAADMTLTDIAGGSIPDLSSYDLTGFATFTDELQLPDLMADAIRALKPVDGIPAFGLVTYGSIPGRILLQLQTLLEQKGFVVIDGLALHAPENYPPMIKSGLGFAGQPSERQLKKFAVFIDRLKQNLQRIAEHKTPTVFPLKVGFFSRMLPIRTKFLSKKAMGAKKVDEITCTRCGLCVKLCPYAAASMARIPVFDESKCRACWACYNHCPTGSIRTKSFSGESRYPKPSKPYLEKLDRL